MAQGAEKIVLFGHSGGVRRVNYYQAERQDPRVVGLILASGTDRVTAIDPARLELAQQLVAAGQGEALLPVPEGESMVFGMQSAAHVVHWERVVGRFAAQGHTPWMASIRVPVLATLGASELEDNPDRRARVEDMRSRAVQVPRFDIQVIEGADHDYTPHSAVCAGAFLGYWLQIPMNPRTARD